jgi:hypothetical protein
MTITAETKEDIEAIVPIIEEWLQPRGLELNPEKTKITHIEDGIDFLGFHIRQFKGRCYTMPQKEKVLALLDRIRTWLKQNVGAKPENPNLAEAKRRCKTGSSHLHTQSHPSWLGQLLPTRGQQEDLQLYRPSGLESIMAMGKETASAERKKVDRREIFHAPSRQTMDVLHHSRKPKRP